MGVDTDEDRGVGLEWDHFDNLRERHVSSSAPPSDIYRVSSLLNTDNDVADGCQRNYYDLRHITNINPFLVGGVPFQVFVDSAGAGLLALHHFNHGISDVVPEIGNVAERCRTRFTMDFIDTYFSPLEASRAFLEDVLKRGRHRGDADRRPRRGGGDGDTGRNVNASSAEGLERRRGQRRGLKRRLTAVNDDELLPPLLPPVPTVVIGAARSAVTSPLAILGGVHGVPQISYASTSTDLDNRDQYPLFGRVVPSAAGDAEAAVSYLTDVLGATHIGVLHVRDSYGTTYAQALSAAAARTRQTGSGPASSLSSPLSPSSLSGPPRLVVRVASFPSSSRTPEARRTVIAEAVRQMRESGLRYFFGVFYPHDYNEIMSEVMRQGIAGPGYFWMFGDTAEGLVDFRYDPETQADLIEASRGSAILTAANPDVLAGKPRFEAFRRHWDDFRAEGSRGRAYFDSKVPPELRDAEGGELLRRYRFGDVQFPTALMSYDAVISAAFAVCDAEAASRRSVAAATGVGDNGGPARITGADVHNSFLNVTFDGLYGTISIDPATASQIPQTAPYSVSNMVTDPVEDGKLQLSFSMTDVIEAKRGDSGGEAVSSWRNIRPFIFSDETIGAPLPLPPVEHNPNLIGSVVGAGYAMFIIVLLTSLCFSIWTRQNSERRVIKSAQPVFLYIIASGTVLMAGSIITSGVEEPTSQAGLDISCMATAWLISVGFSLTFAALFAKTWRLNRLMKRNMRRIKVDVGQVMRPAAAMVAMNVVIMLVWTLVAPLKYERIPVAGSQDEFGRPTQSYGTCALPPDPKNSDQHWWVGTFFIVLITVVNSMMLAVALYQVYRTRNFEMEFSECKYVALSMFSILQALIIGTPLIFVGQGHPAGLFFMLSSIIFIMCESILLLIFVPKVYFLKEWRKRQEYLKAEQARKMQTPSWEKANESDVEKDASVRGSAAARFCNVTASVLDRILPKKEFDAAIAAAPEEVMGENQSYIKQEIISTEPTCAEVLHPKTTNAVTVSSWNIALKSTPDDITHMDLRSGAGGSETWMKTSRIAKVHIPRLTQSEEHSFHDETQRRESEANAANGFEAGLGEVEAWMKTSRVIKIHVPRLSEAEEHSFHDETQRHVSEADAAQVREHASSALPRCDSSSSSRRKLMEFFAMLSSSARRC